MATAQIGDTITKARGWFDIFPLAADPDKGIGLPAWRWMAVVQWYEPGDQYGFPRQAVMRHPCPLKLMRWVYATARAAQARVREMPEVTHVDR